MTETSVLLPCPFCGGEQLAVCPDGGLGWHWSVMCKACGAEVQRDDEVVAITAWNTRAVSAAEGDLLGKLIDAAREHIEAGLHFLVADSDHDNAGGVNQPRDTYAASFERKLAAAKRVDESRKALNAILSQAREVRSS